MKSFFAQENGPPLQSANSAAPIIPKDQTTAHVDFPSLDEGNRIETELVTLRKAVEKSGEVIFLTNREGIITYVNPEFTSLYGHESEAVIGQTTPRILKSGMMTAQDYGQFW